MTQENYVEKYLEYLKMHISYVQKSYEKLLEIIPDLFSGYDKKVQQKTEEHIKEHDKIKFDPHNLRVYGEHFVNKHNIKEYRLTYFGEEKDWTFEGGIAGKIIKAEAASAFRYIRADAGTLRAEIERD